LACVKFIIFARIIIERTGFYFFTPLKHAKIRNKFALGGNQKKQRETKERHMLTTKILANILVLLTTFGGSAFAAPSIRQIGNIGTSSNSSVKPLPVASNQARAATPMMQKMSSSVVNTAKSATTSATPLYSTEQNRLVVKPLSGGKTNSINLKPTNNVSNTLLLHLDQEVQGIHDTMATLATQGQVNSAVNTAKSEMQDAIDTATEKMVTFGEGGNLNEKIANTATIASIQSELGDKMTEEDVEGIVSDATVGMITSGQSFNNELASTSLYNTVNNETTGLVAKTNALNNVINNESTGLVAKTQALDNTINNTSTGLVAKTQALDNTINNTSTGLLAKTAALDETINNTSTGLVAKTAAIESAFDKDTNGTIKNVKPDFVPSGIPMEKVSGLTGDTGLVAKTNALSDTINNESTGLVAKTNALSNTINNETTGLIAKTNALTTKTSTLEDKFNKDPESGQITTLKETIIPTEIARKNYINTTLDNMEFSVNSDTQKVVYKVTDQAGWKDLTDVSTFGGTQGKSAYQSWLDQGNTGNEGAFIASLKGEDGKTPDFTVEDGVLKYKTDKNDSNETFKTLATVKGKSAYESWKDDGNTGSESEFVAALKGANGKSAYESWKEQGNSGDESEFVAALKGANGKSAYESWKEQGNSGDESEFVAALKGANGKSAYESWKDDGNTGSESEFVAALKGANGKSAYESWKDDGNTGSESEFVAALKGEDGKTPAFTVEDGVLKYKTDKNDSNETFKTLATVKGKSAYESWKDDGNTGSESEFVAALKGANGKSAYESWKEQGNSGSESEFVAALKGKSAYESWKDDGNTGSESEFVAALKGASGKSAYESWKEQGNSGDESEFVASLKGANGKSAYESWKEQGNSGDESEFVAALKGANGKSAYESWKDDGNTGSESEFVASLQGSTCGVTKQEDTETVSGVRQTTVTFINSCTNQAIGNSIVVKDGVDGADAEISEEDITRLKLVTVNEDGVIDAVKIPALNYQAPINDLETIRGNASTGAGLSGAVSTLQGKFDTNGNLKTDNLVLPDTVITTTTPKYQALMNNVNSSGQITSTAALPAAVVTSGTDGNIGTVLAANNVVTGGRTGNFATLLDNSSLASTVSDLENSVSDNGDLVDSLIDALVQGNYITRTGNSISIKTIAVEK